MVKRKARTMKFRRKRSHNKRSQYKRSHNKRRHTRKYGGGTPSRLNPNAGPPILPPVKSRSKQVEPRLEKILGITSVERKKAEEANFEKLTKFMQKEAERENRAAAHRKNSQLVQKPSNRRSRPSSTMASLAEVEE